MIFYLQTKVCLKNCLFLIFVTLMNFCIFFASYKGWHFTFEQLSSKLTFMEQKGLRPKMQRGQKCLIKVDGAEKTGPPKFWT